MIGVFCPKEKKIPFLDSFFNERITYSPAKYGNELKAITAFGNDSSIRQGRKLAAKKRIPFYSIKPGLSPLFLEGNQPLFDYPYSYMISQSDNSERDLELENLLESINIEPSLLEKAQLVLDAITQEQEYSEYIVLVDQLNQGNRDQASAFQKMLDETLNTYPKQSIKILSFSSGNGYLKELCQDTTIEYIENTAQGKKLLKSAKKVMVMDAPEGFIPLLFNKEVHSYGQPFYSGWGFTKDKIKNKEHTRNRTLLELFTIVFYLFEKQINPLTGLPTDLNDILEVILYQRYLNNDHEAGKKVYCFGIQPWKRGFVRPFVKTPSNTVLFPKSAQEVKKEMSENSELLVWGHKEPSDVKELAEELNKPIMRIEDGFIRSVGLGTNVTLPWSLALDHMGIYYNPQEVSELETILNQQIFTENMIEDARRIRQKIVENQLTKYNSEPIETLQLPSEGKKVILVPGQVEDDASIRYGCKDIKTNTDLLNCVRQHNPDAYIIYKPHPDIVSKNRQGDVTSDFISGACDHIEIEASIISCIQYSDEVHTMTSLTGFDALLRDKKVFTYGSPFYSGWGLTEDRHPVDRRTRSLTLDELIAGALLVYPRYYDWENKIRVSCDTVVEKLIDKRNNIFKEGQVKKQVNIPNRIKKVGFLLKELIENH